MKVRLRKILSLVLALGLLLQQTSFAQLAVELNIADHLAIMSNRLITEKFRPLHLRYFSYDLNSDNFKVLVDKGDQFSRSVIATRQSSVAGKQSQDQAKLQEETKTLLNYFLVGVTLPDEAFWVNLRPDSESQIIDPWLEQTDVGKIMLEADLQLKKDTALFTSPQTPEGRQYWDRLYKKAEELYGYNTATIPTLTRPWIVPGEIIVRESNDSAYVYKAVLKVMLEQDYLKDSTAYNFKDERSKALNEYSSQLIRELIIPRLTKEVNSSKRYAALRQVYYSLILSRWFKTKFSQSSSLRGAAGDEAIPANTGYVALIDAKNLTNLTSRQPWSKSTYFKQYQKSFSEGEYNVKEPVYTPTGQVIRSYFSGGIEITGSSPLINNRFAGEDNLSKLPGVLMGGKAGKPSITLQPVTSASPVEGSPAFQEAISELSGILTSINNTLTIIKQSAEVSIEREVIMIDRIQNKKVPEDERIREISQNMVTQLNAIISKLENIRDSDFSNKNLSDYINALMQLRKEIGDVLGKWEASQARISAAGSPLDTPASSAAQATPKAAGLKTIKPGQRVRLTIRRLDRYAAQYGRPKGGYITFTTEDKVAENDPSLQKITLTNVYGTSTYFYSEITKLEVLSSNRISAASPISLTASLIFEKAHDRIMQYIKNIPVENWRLELERLDDEVSSYIVSSYHLLPGENYTVALLSFIERLLESSLRLNEKLLGEKEKQRADIIYSWFKMFAEHIHIITDAKVPDKIIVTYSTDNENIVLSTTTKSWSDQRLRKYLAWRSLDNQAASPLKTPASSEINNFELIQSILDTEIDNPQTASQQKRIRLRLASFPTPEVAWKALEETAKRLRLTGYEEVIKTLRAQGRLRIISFQVSTGGSSSGEEFPVFAYRIHLGSFAAGSPLKTPASSAVQQDETAEVIYRDTLIIKVEKKGREKIAHVDFSLKETPDKLVKTAISQHQKLNADDVAQAIRSFLQEQNITVTTELDMIELPRIINAWSYGASSPVQSAPETTGGIDFRALPMAIQPMGSFSGLDFNLPRLSRAELERINVTFEMQEIGKMVQAGILPSGERIKELIAACVQKGEITVRADNLLLCLIDICKLQEESACESSPEFREALVIVDSQA
ncbi:MAG: hypothetical protein V1828_03775 [Candidatus Omnitrophota bacterium]